MPSRHAILSSFRASGDASEVRYLNNCAEKDYYAAWHMLSDAEAGVYACGSGMPQEAKPTV